MKDGNGGWQGWSDESGGPDGLFALVVPGLGLSTVAALQIRVSLWNAMKNMKLDPRWNKIQSPEDAAQLVREYL